MILRRISVRAVAAIVLIAATPLDAAGQSRADNAQQPWRRIFDGRSLAGWIPKITGHPLGDNYRQTFVVQNGAIRVSYAGYDRTALDAVQKYPWQPGDREIDLLKVTVPVAAIIGGYDNPNARTHRLKREIKGAQITIIPKETHGSVHLNPVYTTTLVNFIDAHDK